jgi:hypothetical protein
LNIHLRQGLLHTLDTHASLLHILGPFAPGRADGPNLRGRPSAVELLLHLATEYGAPDASQPGLTLYTTPVAENDEVIVDAVELKRRVSKR